MVTTPLKNRKDIKLIEREIIQGAAINQVAKKYGIKQQTLYKYKLRHLTRKVVKARDTKDLREGSNLLDYMESLIQGVDKLFRACNKALEDPDDPEQLFLGSSAFNTIIMYLEPDNDGVEHKCKATIQELLDKINKVSTRVEIKGPDRATTLLQAAQTLTKQLHLLGELSGKLGNTTINVTNQPIFIELTQVVMKALSEFPEARTQVSAYLKTLKLEDKTVKHPDRLL